MTHPARRFARPGATALVALNLACLAPPRATPAVPTQPAPAPSRVAPRNPGARAAFRAAVDSLVDAADFRNAHWGVLVVDPASGDTLYAHEPGKLFLPASNLKLVTTSVALTVLGPGYRWTTVLGARGPVLDGTLQGDLLVYGRGDPSISDSVSGSAMAPLRAMADSLAAAGVRRVAGRLLAAGDAFPGPTVGFGWSWDDLGDADGAAIDELLFNDGFGELHVRAGASPGARPTVTTTPAARYPTVRIEARTVARDDTAALRTHPLRATLDTATREFVLRGAITVGDSATRVVAFSDPDGAYLAALAEALDERGIRVDGAVTDTTAPVDTLVRLQSPTLAQVLPAILKPSQNQMAEMVMRTVGLVRTGVGTADSAARVERTQLEAWGADSTGFVLRDGSGLARYDYLTPETIVRVLDAMRRSPAFDALYNALPIAGVDGTLRSRMRGTAAQGNVHAKTGSLSNTRSLSGYVTTADGRLLLFSILCNNFTAPPARVLAVENEIAERLAALDLH